MLLNKVSFDAPSLHVLARVLTSGGTISFRALDGAFFLVEEHKRKWWSEEKE